MTRRGLPDWLVIARRELLERVRTGWFVAVTLLGPIGMVALTVIPALLAGRDAEVRLQVVDGTGALGAPLVEAFSAVGWKAESAPVETPEDELLARIKDDRIDGFLRIPDGVLDATPTAEVVYQGDNATNQVVAVVLSRAVSAAVQSVRAKRAGLSDEQLRSVLMPVMLQVRHTTGEGEGASGPAAFILGYVLMFVLYMAIVLYAVSVMRSVVQEKTNRVVEIMIAAAKPRALMLGKILGVGTAGLIQLAVWIGMAVVTIAYRDQILGFFGASGGFTLPALSASQIAVILGYFVFGYFFYAAIYAAIGAMVNSDQEAQQAQTPVVLLLVIPAACVNVVASDPRGSAAEVLTMIPFSSPVLMPMRYLLGGASGLDVLLSLGILAVSMVVVTWLAGRIYRVGILMYGKRPSIGEIVKWMRHG